MRSKIIEFYGGNEEIVFADGFDSAIIGFEPNLWKVVYSRAKCIESMVSDSMDDMDVSEVEEYLEFNTFGAYVGENTPLWVEDFKWNI